MLAQQLPPFTARPCLLLLLLALCPSSALAEADQPPPDEERAPVAVENTPQACQNGADDDGDGAIDCADESCAQLIFCLSQAPAEEEPEASVEVEAGVDGQPGTRGIYAPRVVERRPQTRYAHHEDPRRYPQAQVQTPMTYLRGMGVATLGFSAFNLSADPLVQLGIGVSYGLFDFLQLDVLLPVLRLSPSVEVDDPAVALLARLFHGDVAELGLRLNVVIPIHDRPGAFSDPWPSMHLLADSRLSSNLQLDLGLPFRFHFGGISSLDIRPMAIFVIDDPDFRADITIPIRLSFQLGDYVYAGVESGVFIPGPEYGDAVVGLGALAGVTVPGADRGPIVDAQIRFGWPQFYNSGLVTDPIQADFWQLTFQVKVMTYLLP